MMTGLIVEEHMTPEKGLNLQKSRKRLTLVRLTVSMVVKCGYLSDAITSNPGISKILDRLPKAASPKATRANGTKSTNEEVIGA